MNTATRKKHPIDVHVGKRLRSLRWMRGISQQELGSAVGIKFQQIQKFETGLSRISASRLYELGEALNVPIDYFYAGLKPSKPKPKMPDEGKADKGSDLSIAQIRTEVRRVYPQIQDRLAYMVQLVLEERSKFAILPIPNEPEALAEYEQEDKFLSTMQASLISVHDDLPPLASEEISEVEAEKIKDQLLKLAQLANQAVDYLDRDTGTYGGLYKVGLISGIAALLSIIPGVNFVGGAG